MAEKKTIGISMRVVQAAGYGESRDALAHDWYPFLQQVLRNEANWLLIPNLGAEAVIHYVRAQSIDGLILSGGNDIGDSLIRDETETALIQYALQEGLPLAGICRGLQLIWQFFGGSLEQVNPDIHVASRHRLYPTPEFSVLVGDGNPFEVNSYHATGLSSAGRPEALTTLAITQDQQIEAVRHQHHAILGLMWHPEREKPYIERDICLLRTLLLGDKD